MREHIKVQTTQNVAIEYEIANIGDRMLAYLVDLLIIFGYLMFVGVLISALPPIQEWIYFLMLLIPITFYDLACEIFLDGQSIGKRVREIKVIKTDGTHAGLGNYLLRWLLRPIDITFTYGVVAMCSILWNGRGQRLGDLAAATTVIKIKQRVHLEDTIFANVDENHQLTFPQVEQLTDQEIAVVKEVLSRYRTAIDRKSRDTLARRAIEKLENIMQIENRLPAEDFLDILIKDYNYLKGRI